MAFAFGETITIVRGGAVTFPTMGDAPESSTNTVIDHCAVWPASSTELVDGQDTVTWDLELIVPVGTDLRPTDQVIVHGTTYEVVGNPMHWRSPFTGTKPGTQVQLRAMTG